MPTKNSKYRPFYTRGIQQQKILKGFMEGQSSGRILFDTYKDTSKDTKTLFNILLGLSKNIQDKSNWLNNQIIRPTGIEIVDDSLKLLYDNPIYKETLQDISEFYYQLEDIQKIGSDIDDIVRSGFNYFGISDEPSMNPVIGDKPTKTSLVPPTQQSSSDEIKVDELGSIIPPPSEVVNIPSIIRPSQTGKDASNVRTKPKKKPRSQIGKPVISTPYRPNINGLLQVQQDKGDRTQTIKKIGDTIENIGRVGSLIGRLF